MRVAFCFAINACIMGLSDIGNSLLNAVLKRLEEGESVRYDSEIEGYARIAAHVYGDFYDSILPEGCEVVNEYSTDNGLYAKAYVLDEGILVCAFAGTRNMVDWENNITQLTGSSIQYEEALEYACAVIQACPDMPVVFVGHSQGGGEAAYCAFALGATAVTFNPAGLSQSTIDQCARKDLADVHTFVFSADVLNLIQESLLDMYADGTIHYISDYIPTEMTFGEWHGMKGILRYFGVKI